MSRLMSNPTIAKTFIVLREDLCSGDRNHPMRKHITVERMEKYTKVMDKFYKGKVKKS